jgi:ribonuclease D
MELLQENRLSREYINELPIVRFEGEVVLVDEPQQAETVVRRLSGERCVGFDTESRPAFKKGESYPVSLVQLATHDTAFLFQLEKCGFPDTLAELLADGTIKKIGVGIKHDIEKLQELKKFTSAGFIDLSKIAKEKGIIQIGARSLTARYLGCRLVKSSQKTNWAKRHLTRKQQLYAAADAWICLEIYPRLKADKTDYRQFIEDESADNNNENGENDD